MSDVEKIQPARAIWTYVAGQIQPAWAIWTYVAGQTRDISRHRAWSIGSMLAHLAYVGRTVGFLDVAQIQPVWVIWTYVAGQKGDISPHRVRSIGSMLVLDVCCGPKRWHFYAPRPVYVCPTLVHLKYVGRTVGFLEGCFAEGYISRHRAPSLIIWQGCDLGMRVFISSNTKWSPNNTDSNTNTNAKKVTFLGTAPGLSVLC